MKGKKQTDGTLAHPRKGKVGPAVEAAVSARRKRKKKNSLPTMGTEAQQASPPQDPPQRLARSR